MMQRRAVTLAELKTMSPSQRKQRLAELAAATRRPASADEIEELETVIARIERWHGFSTAELRVRLAAGTLKETAAICEWLMLAGLLDRLRAYR